jgi:hypothetical protein
MVCGTFMKNRRRDGDVFSSLSVFEIRDIPPQLFALGPLLQLRRTTFC